MHDQKNNQVLVVVRKDILNKTIIKNWTDLISHFYSIVLVSTKLKTFSDMRKKKTRRINIYDNKIGEDQRC